MDELELKLPVINAETLNSGIRIYHIDDNSAPMFEVSLLMKYPVYENPGATVYIDSVFNKGYEKDINYLEERGAVIELKKYETGIIISCSSLEKYSSGLISLLSRFLSNITIENKEIEKSDKKNENLQANVIVDTELDNRLFDIDSSRSIFLDKAVKDTIGIVIGVKGSCDLSGLEAEFNDIAILSFDNYCRESKLVYSNKYAGTELKVNAASGLKSDYLRMGYLVDGINSNDYFTLLVASNILNRHLLYGIRLQKGLVYQIGSVYVYGNSFGKVIIASTINPDKTDEVLKEVKQVILDFSEGGIDEKEVEITKKNIQYEFMRKVYDESLFLEEVLKYDCYGMNDDFINSYFNCINNVSRQNVMDCFKNNLNNENVLTVILTGNK